jgi:hypothetical protein
MSKKAYNRLREQLILALCHAPTSCLYSAPEEIGAHIVKIADTILEELGNV